MKAAIYRVHGRHHSVHADAMIAGLRRHGVSCEAFVSRPDEDADFCTVWGWRLGERLRASGYDRPILVMERGYLGDRFNWTSLGWDGLNGRARFNEAHDGGERFWNNFGHLACEWEVFDEGYDLLIGQVVGDMALAGVNYAYWVTETMSVLSRAGRSVKFREHPEAVRRQQPAPVDVKSLVGGTLQDAFAGARRVITWNSNAGVEAALAGIPVVALDHGSMAWPVAAHDLDGFEMPDRAGWFRDMAWRQWLLPEIASGRAWETVREAM